MPRAAHPRPTPKNPLCPAPAPVLAPPAAVAHPPPDGIACIFGRCRRSRDHSVRFSRSPYAIALRAAAVQFVAPQFMVYPFCSSPCQLIERNNFGQAQRRQKNPGPSPVFRTPQAGESARGLAQSKSWRKNQRTHEPREASWTAPALWRFRTGHPLTRSKSEMHSHEPPRQLVVLAIFLFRATLKTVGRFTHNINLNGTG